MTANLGLSATPTARSRSLVTFRLGGVLHGVDIHDVKEVSPRTDAASVPLTPPDIVGYVNLRGRIHLVLDPAILMGKERTTISERSRLIVFKPQVQEDLAMLVDEIGDIRDLPGGDKQPWECKDEPILGVGRFEDGLVVVLDPRRLASLVEARVNSWNSSRVSQP